MKREEKDLSKMQQYVAPAMEVLNVEVSANILAGSVIGEIKPPTSGGGGNPKAKQWSGNSIFDEVETSEEDY